GSRVGRVPAPSVRKPTVRELGEGRSHPVLQQNPPFSTHGPKHCASGSKPARRGAEREYLALPTREGHDDVAIEQFGPPNQLLEEAASERLLVPPRLRKQPRAIHRDQVQPHRPQLPQQVQTGTRPLQLGLDRVVLEGQRRDRPRQTSEYLQLQALDVDFAEVGRAEPANQVVERSDLYLGLRDPVATPVRPETPLNDRPRVVEDRPARSGPDGLVHALELRPVPEPRPQLSDALRIWLDRHDPRPQPEERFALVTNVRPHVEAKPARP